MRLAIGSIAMIGHCLASAAAFAVMAGAAFAQTETTTTDHYASRSTATSDSRSAHGTAHKTAGRKKPAETWEWTEDTWTETHHAPSPPPPPMMVQRTTRTTTTTTTTEK